MIKVNFKRIQLQELISTIRGIKIVLGAYPINIKTLKSREHFLFTQDFKEVIETGPGVAPGYSETRRMD